jgi:glyoxylase-like metal-dependent hydrolase (beta-lactamase superfamily II)
MDPPVYAPRMMTDAPAARSARIDVLLEGSLEPTVRSTCTLVRDGELVAVIDPGLAPSQAAILDPLSALGVAAEDVTAVILSHHHPDHTINAALFPAAAVHDHWAVYRGDDWESRECEGAEASASVRLIRTPGHSAEDLSTLIRTPDGIAVATHLWWTADGPADDPYAPDRELLRRSRERVLGLADLIIPGHGAPFRPGAATPR